MPDREKVIGHLNDCMEASRRDNTWVFVRKDIVADAIDLLKKQENKKLIDADKLREKLGFAECCEDCKRDSWKCGRETIYSLNDFCAAIDIAIEELMQEGR